LEGKARQRQGGGGAKGAVPTWEDKLRFILVSQQTTPLQPLHARHFGVSQPQAHYWSPHLRPVVQRAVAEGGGAPEREASRVAASPLALAGSLVVTRYVYYK
jgi:hypothetical protein